MTPFQAANHQNHKATTRPKIRRLLEGSWGKWVSRGQPTSSRRISKRHFAAHPGTPTSPSACQSGKPLRAKKPEAMRWIFGKMGFTPPAYLPGRRSGTSFARCFTEKPYKSSHAPAVLCETAREARGKGTAHEMPIATGIRKTGGLRSRSASAVTSPSDVPASHSPGVSPRRPTDHLLRPLVGRFGEAAPRRARQMLRA